MSLVSQIRDLAEHVGHTGSKTELLMSSVAPIEKVEAFHIQGLFQGHVPLRTQAFESWPGSLEHLNCLHCGSSCDLGPPMPAVRFFEPQLNVFWVYGPFCSAPCSFGYIAEHEASSSSKQLSLTSYVLRNYFQVHDIQIAPPRSAHQRYGGPLNDLQFRGIPQRGVLDVVHPPFVSFAHYVLAVQDPARPVGSGAATLLSSAAAGKLVDLTRPETRDFGRLEKKTTMRPPMILNFLAERVTSVDATVAKAPEDNLIEERRSRGTKTTTAGPQTEQRGFLSRYMKK